MKAIKEGRIEASKEEADGLLGFLGPYPNDPDFIGFPEVCVWPEMADKFIKSL